MTGPTEHPEKSHSNAGRKSNISIFLDKNPALKAIMLKTAAMPDGAEAEYTDIDSIDRLIEYACFELTRSKNENLLRGKTFCEYEKAFTHLLEMREKLIAMQRESDMKEKLALRNRDESTTFIKIVFEAIAGSVEDLALRKKLSDKVQELYDKYYPEQPAESRAAEGTGAGSEGSSEDPGEVVP